MAIVLKEAYFLSSTGINRIRCNIWEDNTLPKRGVFQIAHGVSEHIDRYDAFARFLASNGFVVCGNDHLGHGKSVDSPEDYGFFAEEDGDLRMVDDMHILTQIMKKRYPGLPYILFGHSMGSFCARSYAAAFGYELDGLILCGTGELPASAAVLEGPIRYLAKKLGPRTPVNNALFDKISTIGIKNKRTDKDWLSLSEANVDAYILDPLCGIELRLGGVRDLISLANTACSTEWPYLVPVGLPILVISGANDPVGMKGRGVITVCDNLESAGHTPSVILYPTFRHEILNEDEKEKVFEDVLEWLTNVLGPAPQTEAEPAAEAETEEA